MCVYHAGCPDGFGAAWSVWSVWTAWKGEGTFLARGHNDRLRAEDFEDALIAFVDIALENDELQELARCALPDLVREGGPIVRANGVEVQRILKHAAPRRWRWATDAPSR